MAGNESEATSATAPLQHPSSRFHIVLVPGFAGFDAIGQVEYYAGITPLFEEWLRARDKRTPNEKAGMVLHYFDNLPTAGVATRAARLRSYLAKRIARGEFREGDRITLIGHSTGGLDIRKMLWGLARHTVPAAAPIQVDGADSEACEVSQTQILGLINGVVFLSVPQWGTNIANWWRDHTHPRKALIAALRAAVYAARTPAIGKAANKLEVGLLALAEACTQADLLLAAEDALREIYVPCCENPTRVAGAHQAASELSLWLQHADWDFSAIDDLAVDESDDSQASPAQFTLQRRLQEQEDWEVNAIRTKSYATVGIRPYAFKTGHNATVFKLFRPSTWPNRKLLPGMRTRTDIVYRFLYRACAGGPFRNPPGVLPSATPLGAHAPLALQSWDNDGIANTASMFWPNFKDTVLVQCDHLDIVGHYQLKKDVPGTGRKYHTYDAFKAVVPVGGNEVPFTEERFKKIWFGVFDFCVRPET